MELVGPVCFGGDGRADKTAANSKQRLEPGHVGARCLFGCCQSRPARGGEAGIRRESGSLQRQWRFFGTPAANNGLWLVGSPTNASLSYNVQLISLAKTHRLAGREA